MILCPWPGNIADRSLQKENNLQADRQALFNQCILYGMYSNAFGHGLKEIPDL
ncbi:hypothetical protein DEHRE_10620 [Dehalobacter restrictus DSM 9455]|uniref:Uncharacterized protein n=1 Tax=Dehalobacter restrictus (strain DSM 9455 / PER-K23) TaxID=871738 RepID=A0ABN4C1H4_DEHRP|nr:hypothetical protein DEHRE_10620 [Dehalobacter restrictus DSM 9455]